MIDRAVEFPNRYKIIQVPGQPGVFDLTPFPGDVTEVGTPISKNTLLKDTTYDLFKLSAKTLYPSDKLVLPDDMFRLLSGAYASSLVTILSGGQLRHHSYSNPGTGSGNSFFSTIEMDLTGRCTKNVNDSYCDRVYIPKGASKVLVYTHIMGLYSPAISLRVDGVDTAVVPTTFSQNYNRYYLTFTLIDLNTPSDGNVYISLYLDVTSSHIQNYGNQAQCHKLITIPFID